MLASAPSFSNSGASPQNYKMKPVNVQYSNESVFQCTVERTVNAGLSQESLAPVGTNTLVLKLSYKITCKT